MLNHTLFPLFLLLSYGGFAQNVISPAQQADSLLREGLELFKKRKYEQSAQVLASAQTFALQDPGRESVLYASVVHYLGTDYQGLGRSKEALPLLQEALEIRQRVLGPDHPECGKTLNNLAIVNMTLGKLNEAEGFAKEALQLKEKDPGTETLEYSNSQNTLAQIIDKKGQFALADSIVTDLLERRKRVLKGEMNIPYAGALNFKAGLLTSLHRFEEAKDAFLQALAIMEQVSGKNSSLYLSVYINLGQIYAKLGEYEKAEETQRDCVQLIANDAGKNSKEYALALRNLGFVLQEQGRFREALPVLEEAFQIAAEIYGPDSPESVQILGNQAATHYYLGDNAKAAELFKRELDVFEKSERRDEEYYRVLSNYGTTLHNLREFEPSEQYLLKAEEAAKYLQLPIEKMSVLHLNFGLLYMEWNKLDMAEERLLRAVKAVTEKRTLFSANDVSVFFRLVQLYQQKGNYAQALKFAGDGQKYLEKSISESVNYLSEPELRDVASFFFSRNNSIFEAAQYWNKPELNEVCYNNILFTKGFVLENALKMRRAFEKSGQADLQKWTNWKTLRRQIAAEYSKPNANPSLIESLEREANLLEKRLAGEVQKKASLKELPHWEQIQAELVEGESAIEFVRYEGRDQKGYYMALVLTKNAPAPQAVLLCEEHQLAQLFGKDTFPLAKFYGSGSNTLYNLVFKPLVPFLGGAKKVYFAPAGLLHRVNFLAMAVSKGNILADEIDLTLLGSTRQIIEKKTALERKVTPKKALLLGGIDYEPANARDVFSDKQCTWPVGKWYPLPASLDEANSASRLLTAGKIQTEVVSGTAATEDLLRKRCSGGSGLVILHISSHATYLPDTANSAYQSSDIQLNVGVSIAFQDPLMRVGIAMAGAKDACNPNRQVTDDGILTAHEVSLLDLDENLLAIVSACDSGLGDLDPDEGVWGLQRAFRIAGSRYVVLSLWKVEDAAANDFMRAFYRNWTAEKKSVHEAFAAAQNELRDFYRDPRYWAGFVLSE
jgi:CHAT domain-containing protein/Tfp pilus assembly protein PilF